MTNVDQLRKINQSLHRRASKCLHKSSRYPKQPYSPVSPDTYTEAPSERPAAFCQIC